MADVLIRDVPDEVIQTIDAGAQRAGVSRSEYLRRMLASSAIARRGKVTTRDLARFADTFADLTDPDVMRGAWS